MTWSTCDSFYVKRWMQINPLEFHEGMVQLLFVVIVVAHVLVVDLP